MTRLKPWLSRWPRGRHPDRISVPIAPGEEFSSGDFYYKNDLGEAVKVSGGSSTSGTIWEDIWEDSIWDEIWQGSITSSAPSQIAGIVQSPKSYGEDSKLLGVTVSDMTTFAFEGTRPPVSGDVGATVNVAFDGGVMVVDPDNNSDARVLIVDVDDTRDLFFVKILSAYRQV